MRRLEANEGGLLRDKRGVYMTEYLIVLVLVAVTASIAIATLGVPLVLYHLSVQTAVTSPVP